MFLDKSGTSSLYLTTFLPIRNRELEPSDFRLRFKLSHRNKKKNKTKNPASQTRQRQPPTISWCRVFHLQDWRWDNSSFHKGKTKPEKEANLLNMCRVADTAPTETRTFVRPLPGSQEVIAEGQLGTLIPLSQALHPPPALPKRTFPRGGKDEGWVWGVEGMLGDEMFLIKACWRICKWSDWGPRWQGSNFDVPFLSLRSFSFKLRPAGAEQPGKKQPLTPQPNPTQLTLHLPQEPNGILMNTPTKEALHSAGKEEKRRKNWEKLWECFSHTFLRFCTFFCFFSSICKPRFSNTHTERPG